MKPLVPQPSGLAAFLHSIRFRLTLWFVLILALVLAGFSSLIYWTQSRSLRSDVARRLDERSASAQRALGESVLEHESEGLTLTAPNSGDGPSGDEVLILADAGGSILGMWGRAVDQPDRLVRIVLTDGSRAQEPVFLQELHTVGSDGQSTVGDFAFLASPIGHEGQVSGYLIFGRESDVAEQQRRLAASLLLGSMGMLAVAFLGGLWIADRAMRPVASITQAARSIGETDLGRRLNLPGRDELADLAATFDQMIARLQAAFDRQRRFVADSSHELRTPLTIINLEAGRALETDRTPEEYRASLHVVETEGRRMARLVNDLMMLARMDAGQTVMEFKPLDLSQVAGEVLQRLGGLAQQRGVRLVAGSNPPIPVLADRQYLLQMISNLVENGIKYAGSAREVRVETAVENEAAVLRVSDTGPGIPPEHLSLLFDRFYQVDTARSQDDAEPASPQGSGLGLSIAKSIVDAHHGEIRVHSVLQQGTTFEVRLQLQKS
jgi:heavy metal sensor kinase